MEISYFVRTAVPSLLSTPSTQFCDHCLSHVLLFSEQDQLLTILILHITLIHSVTATMQISNNKTFAKGMQKLKDDNAIYKVHTPIDMIEYVLTLCNFLPYSSINANMSYVDG